MKSQTLSLKTMINKLDFLKKTVIIPWNIRKEDLQLFVTNAKEHSQSFVRKKKTKSVKQSKINTNRPKKIENTNICWCQVGYYKTSKNIAYIFQGYKTGWKNSQVRSNSSLYDDSKKAKISLTKEMKKQQNEYMHLKVIQVLIILNFKIF